MTKRGHKCSCGKKATLSLCVVSATANRPGRIKANSTSIRLCDACRSEVQKTLGRLKARSPASRVLSMSVEAEKGVESKLAELARQSDNDLQQDLNQRAA